MRGTTLDTLQRSFKHCKDMCATRAGGASLGTGLQRLVALVGEVEGGRLSLAPLAMEHPLLGWTALRQQAYSHYARAALPELVKLLGSANVLGGRPIRAAAECCFFCWSRCFLRIP